jgi:CDP-diacylglycerol--glycerol-3-phosphate 3-phosphatidyltransferase
MTWTSAFGRGCGVLLDAIVRWLALSRINPNVLTFLGLVVNTVAALLFGYANGDNQARMFRYAGLVIIGSGFFDLVDGRVARASGQVTRFGGFFDSVIDRYSDASQFLGLLVFYARGDRFFYVVLTAFVMISAIMVSYTRARAESLIGSCRVGFMERPERLVLVIIGAVAYRSAVDNHCHPPHPLHLYAHGRSGPDSSQGRAGGIRQCLVGRVSDPSPHGSFCIQPAILVGNFRPRTFLARSGSGCSWRRLGHS